MAKPWEQSWNDIPSGGRPDEPKETGIVPWLKSWVSSDTPKRASNDTGIQPINRKFDEVLNRLIQAESRGKQFDKSGNLLTSPVGAEGVTQVMPKTGKKPGFGVEPMRDKSKEEFERFGRDYLRAMLNEFGGDYSKALAAYNAGHANVKKAVKEGGENWMNFLPKKEETIPYVKKILGDGAQFQGESDKALEQKVLEKSFKFTLGDAAKKGLLSNEGRKAFKDKVKEEFKAEGASGNFISYMRDKYPEEFQMTNLLDTQLKGMTERQIAAVGMDVPISSTNLMSNTRGFVFNESPDRVFIQGSGDAGTLVHEKEHLTTQRSVGSGGKAVSSILGDVSSKERAWFENNPVMQKVFNAGNALASPNEFLSNIADYETSLPEGQSIYDSEFAKELKKKFGDKRTKEFLDQAVAFTLTDKGRIAESDFEFNGVKLDKDASYARQVYQYLKQKFGD